MKSNSRFKFIGHALRGDGPFRPTISYDGYGKAYSSSDAYIIQYPRESNEKYARRCELAYYASPLARLTSKFVAFVASKPVQRDIRNDLFTQVAADTDGKGNEIDVFWQDFMVNAKARGSMLVLIDMPQLLPDTMESQLQDRVVPYWTPIAPEMLTDYEVGDDGKFDYAIFSGTYLKDGEREPCRWRFDRESWACIDAEDKVISAGEHPLGECPLLIFTESGDFPCYGSFSPIADLSKRLFNLDSELDEILRSQTFSLLTFQVPENSTDEERLKSAQVVGATIGTSNLFMHSGNTPAFIAPPDGPAQIYLDRIKDVRDQVNELGLEIAQPQQRESGIAMQMRFQTLNAELARFATRMESLERRAWDLTGKWLQLTEEPEIMWPRDFDIADTEQELSILRDMQETAMPQAVVAEQQKKVVAVQFNGMEEDEQATLFTDVNSEASSL